MCGSATAPYLYVSFGLRYFTSYVICWNDMFSTHKMFSALHIALHSKGIHV